MSQIDNLTVDEFTSPCPLVISEDATLKEVIGLMKDEKVRHIPIVKGDKAIGIISERDLTFFANNDFADKFCAKDLMNEEVFSAISGSLLQDVALEMSKRKIGSAIITEPNGEITGIFTSTDALNALVEVLRGDILTR